MNPTQFELSSIAALIALPDKVDEELADLDESEYRAHLAYNLWQACGEVLATRTTRNSKWAAKRESEREFLSQFKSTERVPLEDFFEIVLPGAKSQRCIEKWKAYLGMRIQEMSKWDSDSTPMSKGELDDAVESDIQEHHRVGLERRGLHLESKRFLEFVNDDLNNSKADKVVRSKWAKLIRPLSKALLAGEVLTADQQALMTSLTPAQQQNEIVKLNLNLGQARKFKAAIEDLKTPPKGRPRAQVKVVPEINSEKLPRRK